MKKKENMGLGFVQKKKNEREKEKKREQVYRKSGRCQFLPGI
jgi:hypothetical protein